jgi:hydroxymethylglutaryl-CoA synthase
MSDYGIHAMGAYAPRYRIAAETIAEAWGRFTPAGIESTAVPDADEDAVTMGWEAATRALRAAGTTAQAVDHLVVATTTPPLEEEDLAVRLGSMLGVAEGTSHRVTTGSTRTGLTALVDALEATPQRGLVVVADCPRGEPHDARDHAAGAAAAAILVGPDAPLRVVDRAERSDPYPGTRFRERGSASIDGIDAGTYDREAFVRPLASVAADLSIDAIDAAALQMPDGKLPYRAARRMGIDTEAVTAAATVETLGDTAAASVPVGLATALADGADRVLAAGWGSGAGANALLLNREAEVPVSLALDATTEVSYASYLRLRGEITTPEPEGGGAYVSVPTWRRSLPQRHRLVAGRCPDCGTYTFPPRGACRSCHALVEFDAVRLPGMGTVEARTEIGAGGAPPEFAPLQSRAGAYDVAIVAFDTPTDGTATAPTMVVGEVTVGDRVEVTQRRIYTQEGVTRYGFKVRRTVERNEM